MKRPESQTRVDKSGQESQTRASKRLQELARADMSARARGDKS